jgi:hypothetical protein
MILVTSCFCENDLHVTSEVIDDADTMYKRASSKLSEFLTNLYKENDVTFKYISGWKEFAKKYKDIHWKDYSAHCKLGQKSLIKIDFLRETSLEFIKEITDYNKLKEDTSELEKDGLNVMTCGFRHHASWASRRNHGNNTIKVSGYTLNNGLEIYGYLLINE